MVGVREEEISNSCSEEGGGGREGSGYEGDREDTRRGGGEWEDAVLLRVLPSQDGGGGGEPVRENGSDGVPQPFLLRHHLGSRRLHRRSHPRHRQPDAEYGTALASIPLPQICSAHPPFPSFVALISSQPLAADFFGLFGLIPAAVGHPHSRLCVSVFSRSKHLVLDLGTLLVDVLGSFYVLVIFS